MKRLLLVDDNQKYMDLLKEHFENLGYTIDTAVLAGEGLAKFQEQAVDYYDVIVTDITMETQLAGVTMLKRMYRLGYRGTVVVASTAYDVLGARTLSRLFLKGYGVDYLIPKTTVLKKDLDFWPIRMFTGPVKEFQETGK